ncbi:hypothetical protein WDZ16_13020 [Pseudokineococcus marinus]|uniref:Uncharacterized protein n=1 Tax=Pseudokineococcus marinus TaxID=351215 RepID=A0A849BKN9_9ACTN|nr:hypothetical protein [Pseudokineococcus marinus]NNH21657.1 hypothetical protein [Pseudokineococcus marinus]
MPRPRELVLPTGPSREAHPDGEQLLEEAMPRALALAGAVRDEGVEGVAAVTDRLERDELVALAVALAALVDVDAPASDLLAWAEPAPESPEQLRSWHAAWKRGRRDEETAAGERRYQSWRRAEQRRRGQLRVVPAEVAS